MAFRIHDSVVRGEIDNRIKGVVRGRVWLEGRETPLELALAGNAHPDLAGCRLTFVNPLPRQPDPGLEALHPLQEGTIGDLTASRKARVPAVPMEEFLHWPKEKGRPPSRWANCLYLEWFSEANGRVVIESADFELTISAPEWRLTPEEDRDRARQAADGMHGFFGQLSAAVQEQERRQKPPDAPWDEHDYERSGIDWIRTSDGDVRHPLQHRCFESAAKLRHAAADLGRERLQDPDLDQCIGEFQTSSAKLAGALNSLARGGPSPEPAFTVAYLKRALDHLHKAHAGLEAVAPKRLLPEVVVAEARAELLAIREGILRLMDELRGRR